MCQKPGQPPWGQSQGIPMLGVSIQKLSKSLMICVTSLCYQQTVKSLSSVRRFLVSLTFTGIILLKCMSPNVFIYFA